MPEDTCTPGPMTFEEFATELDAVRPTHSRFQNFHDLIEAGYCSLARLTATDPEFGARLERRCRSIMEGFPYRSQRALCNLFTRLWETVDPYTGSYLGDAHHEMKLQNLNPGAKQIFTPYHICLDLAQQRITKEDIEASLARNRPLRVADVTSGSGAFLIAAARTVEELGFDPSTVMLATLIEKDSFCMQMGFLQCCFKDIPAICIHGDSLSGQYQEIAYTPTALRQSRRFSTAEEGDPATRRRPTLP